MSLRLVSANARSLDQVELAAAELKAWLSWARRSRLGPFKRLAATLRSHFESVVRGMLGHRSHAFVEVPGVNCPAAALTITVAGQLKP